MACFVPKKVVDLEVTFEKAFSQWRRLMSRGERKRALAGASGENNDGSDIMADSDPEASDADGSDEGEEEDGDFGLYGDCHFALVSE